MTELKGSEILKTVPIIRDLSLNPCCEHGPTILFERDKKRFFSCSAYRSRKLCQFFMPEDKWKGKSSNETATDEDGPSRKRMKLNKNLVDHPLSLPNQRDKGEAQYHFNDKTVKFLLAQLSNLQVDSVLCIGTPSLHQEIQKSSSNNLKSFFLDIDQRFMNSETENFALYNMCNHHFFHGPENYQKFLKKSKKLALIVDPPFGVKVELIWNGCLRGVLRDFEQHDSSNDPSVSIFWIFPYFQEGHILSKCPEAGFKMSDFHVEYRNHTKFSGGSRSKASPIRIFTNVSLSKLTLPEEEYRFCSPCGIWVDKRNLHCDFCATCTTKDGGPTYHHCTICKKCVKPSWKHCSKCKSCHLADSNALCEPVTGNDVPNARINGKMNLKGALIKKTIKAKSLQKNFRNICNRRNGKRNKNGK